MSEHETDLLRDHPQLQALVVGEIFNDPRAEERGSHDSRLHTAGREEHATGLLRQRS